MKGKSVDLGGRRIIKKVNGVDSFTYPLTDVDGDVSTATVTVNVASVDDLPVASNDTINATEDTLFSGNLAGNDTPSGDGGNVWALATGAANGTVTVNADGTFTYTPNANFNGAASFALTVAGTPPDDLIFLLARAITVIAVNDSPVGVADSATLIMNPAEFEN